MVKAISEEEVAIEAEEDLECTLTAEETIWSSTNKIIGKSKRLTGRKIV
jgi:hypothetical protein